MAIGMDKLAGPVSPGDIIMRNEEAPRGAAALLNKMVNKGTRGMYKLPEAEKEMPGFMKDAIKESEQAAVDPSDFRTILRILEAGGNPEDYMEQVKLDASDFRTILKLLEQGFSMEDIENMTQASMLRDKAKTLNEAAPEGEMLAYINPEEAGILKLLGGAGKMTEAGVPSFAFRPKKDKDKGSVQDSFGGSREAYIAGSNMPQGTKPPDTFTDKEQEAFKAGQDEKDYVDRAKSGDLTPDEQATQMAIATQGDKKDPYNIFGDFAKDVLTSPDPYSTLQENKYGKQVLDLVQDFEPLEGNLDDFSTLGVIKAIADGLSKFGDDKEDRMFRDDEKTELTREGFMTKLGEIPGGRSTFFNLLKRTDPQQYYKVVGVPQTSGDIEDLSKQQMISGEKLAKMDRESKEYKDAIRYNRQIDEARMLANKKKDGQQSQQGGGIPAMVEKPAEEVAKEQSEYAGMFDVPGTMMFEGKEVPVGRRFTTDIGDVMKRALEGTTERQLEPFAQYVKRRRDFLGEDEDEFFDEEGNVIYGGAA